MIHALLLFSLVSAQDSHDLRALFTHRAPVHVAGPGPALIEVPLPVLAEARPDLANLRLLDDGGHEVPYARVPQQVAKPRPMAGHPAWVRDIGEKVQASNPPVYQRDYTLVLPASLLQQGPWQLRVDVPSGEFVADVKISDADGTALANASIFRVPQLPAKTVLGLPPLSAEHDHVLTVSVSSLRGHLNSVFSWVPAVHQMLPPSASALSMIVLEARHSPGHSVYIVEHPPGLTAATLRLKTSTPTFSRRVSVWDSPSGGDAMGEATLYRLQKSHAGAAAGTPGDIAFLELPLLRSSNPRWRVEIRDDGSPPLKDLTLQVLAEPSMLLMQAGDRPVSLYVGGNRTFLHHDLAGLMQAAMPELSRVPRASVGALEKNPDYDETPTFTMRAGAEVDPRLYSHVRSVRVPEAPEGISMMQLGAEDLAASQNDLKDVRLVDANNRQWPALLVRDGTHTWQPTPLEALPPRGKTSVYRVKLPSDRTRIAGLALDSAADWFERPYILQLKLPNGQVDSRPGQLQRRPNRPGELIIETPIEDVVGAELLIDNGDNPPLSWQGSRTLLISSTLYAAAAPGAYRLLMGNPDDAGAHDELNEMRDLVQTVIPDTASVGPVAVNPDHNKAFARALGIDMPHVALWSALALAVLGLGLFTLQQIRQMGPAK